MDPSSEQSWKTAFEWVMYSLTTCTSSASWQSQKKNPQSVNKRCKNNRREDNHYPKYFTDPEASSSIRDTSILSQWGQGRGGRSKYLFVLFTSLSLFMKTVGNQNRHPSAYGNCRQTINGNKPWVRGLVRRFYGRCSEQETFQILPVLETWSSQLPPWE